MGVSSVVEHTFNETAMRARAQASNRLEKANRASHVGRRFDLVMVYMLVVRLSDQAQVRVR